MSTSDFTHHALRGAALTYTDDPFRFGTQAAMRYEPDAIVCMSGGKITHFGPAKRVLFDLPPDTLVERMRDDTLMLWGSIDSHVHYPPTDIVGTRGGQLSERLQDRIGSLAIGLDADLIVLDLKATPVIEYRMRGCDDLEEALFIQIPLGDDRSILATYVAGKLAYHRS